MYGDSLSLIGTTSSGKSTIGNLLSCRYIFPAGVQETTTNVIEVSHDIHNRTARLSLFDPERSPRFETRLLTDDAQIRRCIADAMSTVDSTIHIGLRLSLKVKDSKCSRRNLYLKYRLVGRPVPDVIGVKNGFSIRDFPGFQHHQDERRLRIIEKHFDDRGTAIYTFNSEETDYTKEEQLLAALFAMQRRRGRDWRSIIFVLNRQDAFYRDLDPVHSLRSALTARQASIRRLIGETWDQASVPTPNIEIIPLAAGPAFASEMLCWQNGNLTPTDREFLKYQVENMAFPLLPVDLQHVLPRSPSRWTYRQWLLVCRSIRTTSGLSTLMKALTAQARQFQLASISLSPRLRRPTAPRA